MPETQEERDAEMAAWGAWFEQMGAAVVDGGAPVGMSKTVSTTGVEDNGGSNPLSGYTLVEADTIEAALTMAKGSPHLKEGTIEVAECIDMSDSMA